MVEAGQIAGNKKPAIKPAWIVLLAGYSDGSIKLDSQKKAAMNSIAPIALYISCFSLIFRPTDRPWLLLFRYMFATGYVDDLPTVQDCSAHLVFDCSNILALAYPKSW